MLLLIVRPNPLSNMVQYENIYELKLMIMMIHQTMRSLKKIEFILISQLEGGKAALV